MQSKSKTVARARFMTVEIDASTHLQNRQAGYPQTHLRQKQRQLQIPPPPAAAFGMTRRGIGEE